MSYLRNFIYLLIISTFIYAQDYFLSFDGEDDYARFDNVFSGHQDVYSIFFDVTIHAFSPGTAILVHRNSGNDKYFH